MSFTLNNLDVTLWPLYFQSPLVPFFSTIWCKRETSRWCFLCFLGWVSFPITKIQHLECSWRFSSVVWSSLNAQFRLGCSKFCSVRSSKSPEMEISTVSLDFLLQTSLTRKHFCISRRNFSCLGLLSLLLLHLSKEPDLNFSVASFLVLEIIED